MKRTLSLTALLMILSLSLAKAQTEQEADSLIYRLVPVCDSSLLGRSVFSVMPSGVSVSQPQSVADALSRRIAGQTPGIEGYRVRIYFANNQNSRIESETAEKEFMRDFPGVMAYRSYQNPFFKVTVGDFRTKSEALSLLSRLKGKYPAAFIVKERINYPPIDRESEVMWETVNHNIE